MPRKKKVDAVKLVKAVESGVPSKEIMGKFGIKTLAQLKALYLDALAEQGQVKGIISARGRAAAPAEKTKDFRVNKRGSLVVPREIVEEMGFQIGDSFAVRKTKAGISLKKQ